MRHQRFTAVLLLLVLGACASVDETEHCVNTRYGKVISEKLASGLSGVMFSDIECFPLTQQAFPQGSGGENAPRENVPVITADSVAVVFEVALDWHYTDAWKAFQVKRSHDRVLQEISNGLRSGARDAGATLKMSALFGAARAALDEKFKDAVQLQLGPYIFIDKVYVRGIDLPDGIQKAWTAAAQARAGQQQARDAYVTDSLNARRTIILAETEARKRELEIRAAASSPVFLEVEKVKALATLLNHCTSNCFIGGDMMNRYFANPRN